VNIPTVFRGTCDIERKRRCFTFSSATAGLVNDFSVDRRAVGHAVKAHAKEEEA
jgi:hypothetical protein